MRVLMLLIIVALVSASAPRSAQAHYQLALAQLKGGSLQQAKTELKEASSIAPNFGEAVLLLAQLNIQTGAAQPAIEQGRLHGQ